MFSFNFKLAFRLIHKALSADKHSDARLTRKRLSAIAIHFPLYTLNQLINGFCLLLDEIIFPKYHHIAIEDPVFIIGFPRSGTTYIHRLLARDEQFTTIRFWEIAFAPSITQKKVFKAIGRLDRKLGSPISTGILRWEETQFKNAYHPVGFFEPEEDDSILMHIFSSFFLIFMFPFYDALRPLCRFDLELPEKDRHRIMNFYKSCVQRHLYVFGKDGQKFLSKNPAFSTRILSLKKSFPTARFIYMVRNPLESIPSEISHRFFWIDHFYSPLSTNSVRDYVMDMAKDYYRFPLNHLPKLPGWRHAIQDYDGLIKDPIMTIYQLYDRLGFSISDEFRTNLHLNRRKASGYRSQHEYSPEKVGLTQEMITTALKDVFDQFGFETNIKIQSKEA
jgi:omega-hydroxy-beta-dihydromenaquinone-9 sulfotransferase